MQPHNGPTPYVTLGDDSTQCPIKNIGSVEIYLPSNQTIKPQNMIDSPSLIVPLYNKKRYMKIVGCYKYSFHNTCTIAFPITTIVAENK